MKAPKASGGAAQREAVRDAWLTVGACLTVGVCLAVVVGCAPAEDAAPTGSPPSETLRAPDEFAEIADDGERAAALFAEMGKVLQHPRCVNCHPAGQAPLQGDDSRPHEPMVVRGPSGLGRAGMLCITCHQTENVPITGEWSMPGHPRWLLAPASAAWAGQSLAEICAQVKDPARNGGMSLDEIVHHMGEDPLVGWAWSPGAGRERVPGTQERLAELTQAWVDAGAGCPEG